MLVGDAFLANSMNGHLDRQFILEASRPMIIATRSNSRPTDPTQFVIQEHVQPQMPEQFVFGLLHINEERREMDDPGGIGLDEFHAASSHPTNSSVIHHRQVTRQRRAAGP